MGQREIKLYRLNQQSNVQLEVRIDEETVWLTQMQMVELFESSKRNISLYINNIFKEEELEKTAVVKYSLTTALDGKKYQTAYYSLDVIISVGYRVKSKRGTQFRIWANKILKEYLLKGHLVDHRIDKMEHKMNKLEQRTEGLELLVKSALPAIEGVFYDGQIFDAYSFVNKIIKSAKSSIILIDNKTIYHFGASLKDLGKKWFAFSKMELDVKEMLFKLKE